MNNNIVILGAGISGITCGYFLGKGKSAIYEARQSYGGLCDNFLIGDFLFDNAVHLSFTDNIEVREIFDKVSHNSHKPLALNYYKGNWLKHPVQNNLFPLPVEDRVNAITSFLNRPDYKKINNYRQWINAHFGKFIAKEFSIPYTRKYWCDDGRNLSMEWINNRMYTPGIEEMLFGSMTDVTPNTYYAKEMRYPVSGGYKGFLGPMVKQSNIILNKEAIFLDTQNKYIEFSDGTKAYYDILVSSIPLPELIRIIKDIPSEIRQASENLVATSIILASVGFSRVDTAKSLWYYIYDEDMMPARVYSPSLKSPNNAPTGFSSLQFEIYYSKFKPLNMDCDNLSEHISEIIKKLGIADRNEIMFIDCRKIKYANVVFYKNMQKNRKVVLDYLDRTGIVCIGRFGEWDYLWSDQSFMSGKNAALKFLNYAQ